jgi:hypothetical protein
MRNKIIDYRELIIESTIGFVGREWVTQAIDDFLEDEDPRFFLLLGEPGCGKTALMATLVQQRNYPHHFIGRGSQGGLATSLDWRDPIRFAESIGYQLLRDYGGWVMDWDQWGIQVNQRVRELHGQLIGTHIENFNATLRPSDKPVLTVMQEVEKFGEAAELIGVYVETLVMDFEQIVQELLINPLRSIATRWPNHQVVIVVDGLDEAENYSDPRRNIFKLLQDSDLPQNVRFLLASRPGEHLTSNFLNCSKIFWLSEDEHGRRDSHTHEDAISYLVHLAAEQTISEMLKERQIAPDSFVEQVASASHGNFLYLHHYAQGVKNGDSELLNLTALPQGLYGIYQDFLGKIKGRRGDVSWDNAYKPVLGTLAVAKESLTQTQLAHFSHVPLETTATILMQIKQFLRTSVKQDLRHYAVYHSSFCNYMISSKNEDYVDGVKAHYRIGSYYTEHYKERWKNCDSYGLRYLANHLAQSAEGDPPVQELYGLIDDNIFLTTKLAFTQSTYTVCMDIDLALNISINCKDWPRVIKYGFLYSEYSEGRFGKPNILELYNTDPQSARLEVRLYKERPRFRILIMLALLDALAGRSALANELIAEASLIKGAHLTTSEGEFLSYVVTNLLKTGCLNAYPLLYPALPPETAVICATKIATEFDLDLQAQILATSIDWLEQANKFPLQYDTTLVDAFGEVSKAVARIPDETLRSRLISKLEKFVDLIPNVERGNTSVELTTLIIAMITHQGNSDDSVDIKIVLIATLGAALVQSGIEEQGYALLERAIVTCGKSIFSKNYGILASLLRSVYSSRASKLYNQLLQVASNQQKSKNFISIANALADSPGGSELEAMLNVLSRHISTLGYYDRASMDISMAKGYNKTLRKNRVTGRVNIWSINSVVYNPLIEPETKLAVIGVAFDQLATSEQKNPFWADRWIKRIANWINKINRNTSGKTLIRHLHKILDPLRPFFHNEDVLIGLKLVEELNSETLQAEALRLVLERVNRLSSRERAIARSQVCARILHIQVEAKRFDVLEYWLQTASLDDETQLTTLLRTPTFTKIALQSKTYAQLAGAFSRFDRIQEAYVAWFESIRHEDIAFSQPYLFATRVAAISQSNNARLWPLVVEGASCPDLEVAADIVEVAADSCVSKLQLVELASRVKQLKWREPTIEYLLRMHLALARGWIRLGDVSYGGRLILQGISQYYRFHKVLSNSLFRDAVRTSRILSDFPVGQNLLLRLIPNLSDSSSRGQVTELAQAFIQVSNSDWSRRAFGWIYEAAIKPEVRNWETVDAIVSCAWKLAEAGNFELSIAMIQQLNIPGEEQEKSVLPNFFRESYKILGLTRLAQFTQRFYTTDTYDPAFALVKISQEKLRAATLVVSHEYKEVVSNITRLNIDKKKGPTQWHIPEAQVAWEQARTLAEMLIEKDPVSAMKWDGLEMMAQVTADFGFDVDSLMIADEVTQESKRNELLLDLADRLTLHLPDSALLYWQHCSNTQSRRKLSWIVAQQAFQLYSVKHINSLGYSWRPVHPTPLTWLPLLQTIVAESESFDVFFSSMMRYEEVAQQIPVILDVLPGLNLPLEIPEDLKRSIEEHEEWHKNHQLFRRFYRRITHYISSTVFRALAGLERMRIRQTQL